MKIAFISTILGYRWGGADNLWTHAAEAAADRGDQLLIATSKLTAAHPRIQQLLHRGAVFFERSQAYPHRALYLRVAAKLIGRSVDRRRLTRTLQQFRPDLVILSCGGTYCLSIEPVLAGWLLSNGIPYRLVLNWQSEHPVLGEVERERIGRVFARADHLFFVSSRNLAVTREHLLSSLDQASVVHNPIRVPPQENLPWPEMSEVRLAFLGRLEPVKGVDLLLHALANTLSTSPGWKLAVFGEGPDASHLRRVADHRGIQERISFRGYEPDINRIWAEHHILVSPSVDEGVPMTLPEAMLRGRPVIAANVGGADDWIVPDETGFVCETATVPLLSRVLVRAWERRNDWAEIGLRAAKAAAAYYRPDDFLRVIAPPAHR